MFSSEASEVEHRAASASALTVLTASASASAAATVSMISSPVSVQQQQQQNQLPARARSSIFSSLLHQLSLRENSPCQTSRQPRSWFTGRLRRRLSPLWTSFDESAAARLEEASPQSPGLHLYDSPPPSPAPAQRSQLKIKQQQHQQQQHQQHQQQHQEPRRDAVSASLRRPLMATADCQLWQLQLQRRRKLPQTPSPPHSPPPSPPTPPPRRGRLRPPAGADFVTDSATTCRRIRQQPIACRYQQVQQQQRSGNQSPIISKTATDKGYDNAQPHIHEEAEEEEHAEEEQEEEEGVSSSTMDYEDFYWCHRSPDSGGGTSDGAAFYGRCQAFRLEPISGGRGISTSLEAPLSETLLNSRVLRPAFSGGGGSGAGGGGGAAGPGPRRIVYSYAPV